MRRPFAPLLVAAFTTAALAAPAAAAGPDPGAAEPPALVIREGSVARRQVVALGRDVVVAGEALSDVAALNGSVRVAGTVRGDVIVLGGDVHLAGRARVAGDVFALGGTVDAAPGARVEGRTVAHPTAAGAWLTLLEGPSLGLGPGAPLVLATKLALMAAWMALALLLFVTAGREMLATSEAVRREPIRCFVVGLTGVLSLVLTAVAFSVFAPSVAGVPLLVLVGLFALLLKLWGIVAVFHALGARLLGATGRPHALALNAATTGLLVLGAVKLVPAVGAWVWTLATLIGVGASLSSKFGRQEAWFQVTELERPATAPR